MPDRGADHPAQVVHVVGDQVRLLVDGVRAATAEEGRKAVHDLARRLDEIHEPGADGRDRHAVVAGGLRLLHHADAAVLLDRPQAGGAVGARARQDHAGSVRLLIDREREEEVVDGPAQPARLHELGEFEHALLDREPAAGGDDVDGVALDVLASLALQHVQIGMPIQELRQHALVIGIEVLDDDEGHAGRRLGARQHLPQGFQAAR